MIVRRLAVQGFRCFRNPVELTGLSVGVHLVHAPNESGKSSLVLALARALFDRYGAKDDAMRSLRPWGTSLSPKVTVELETQGRRLLLEKGFLDGAMSRLSEWTGARFELCADAQEADERVRGLLFAEASAKGASDVGNWGLARLLWLTQGPERREMPGLTEPLRQRLLALVGAASLGAEEQALLARIEAAQAELVTAKKSQVRRGGPLHEAEEVARRLEVDARVLSERIASTARIEEEALACERRIDDLAPQRDKLARQAEALEVRAREEAEAQAACALKKKDVESLGERSATLLRQAQDLADLAAQIDEHRAAALALAPRVETARRAASRAAALLAEVDLELAGARADSGAVQDALLKARELDRARQLSLERSRLAERVARAARVEAALDGQRAERGRAPGPTDAEVAELEEAEGSLGRLDARLEALGLEVTFVAQGDKVVRWEARGAREERRLAEGGRAAFRGVDRGTLAIEGVGTVEIRSGAQEAPRLKAERDEAASSLARALAAFGAGSLADLRRVREEASARRRQIEALQGQLHELLRDHGGDAAGARAALSGLDAQIAAAAARLGVAADRLPPAGPPAEIVAESVRAARDRLGGAEQRREAAARAHQGALAEAERLAREAERREHLAQELSAQRQARDLAVGSLAAVRAAAEASGADLARAEAALRGLQRELPAPGEGARARHAQVREALERIAREERAVRDQLARARGALDQAAGEGLYSSLCEAEERLALARAEHARLALRAEASRRLGALAQARREGASRSLVSPIEEAVRARLDYIRGAGRPGALELLPDLGGARVRVDPGAVAPLEALSWGAVEQTMLAVRLSLGLMLAERSTPPEPQLIVLDDPLVNADADRQARALELIAAAGERLQILLLTAFPERYASLPGRRIDLAALAAGAA